MVQGRGNSEESSGRSYRYDGALNASNRPAPGFQAQPMFPMHEVCLLQNSLYTVWPELQRRVISTFAASAAIFHHIRTTAASVGQAITNCMLSCNLMDAFEESVIQ